MAAIGVASKPLNVIIVGGSLAGLFTGILLTRLGHHCTILERSPASHQQSQGAGIVAGDATQAFFRKHDLTHTPIAVTSKLRQYLNKAGEVIDKDEREQRMTSWDLLYNVLRANFDGGGERSYCAVPEGREGEEGRKGAAEYKTDSIVTDIREVDSKKLQIHYRSHAEPDSTKKTQPADLVIAADGASSTIRNLYVPVERKYAGYVAWRGTVPESVILREYPAAAEAFIEKFSFFHADGLQILSYVIPGPNGTVKPGERLVNYVWYCNYPENSEEWRDLMTDTSGKLNSTTLHAGKMRSEVWETQKSYARDVLPPQFADLVCATTEPFVQAISDSILPEDTDNVFAGGRVVCVGDAVAGLRPHTAASTTQAARNALGLESVMKGEMEWKDWQEQTMRWAHETQKGGVTMGERSQFGHHPLSG